MSSLASITTKTNRRKKASGASKLKPTKKAKLSKEDEESEPESPPPRPPQPSPSKMPQPSPPPKNQPLVDGKNVDLSRAVAQTPVIETEETVWPNTLPEVQVIDGVSYNVWPQFVIRGEPYKEECDLPEPAVDESNRKINFPDLTRSMRRRPDWYFNVWKAWKKDELKIQVESKPSKSEKSVTNHYASVVRKAEAARAGDKKVFPIRVSSPPLFVARANVNEWPEFLYKLIQLAEGRRSSIAVNIKGKPEELTLVGAVTYLTTQFKDKIKVSYFAARDEDVLKGSRRRMSVHFLRMMIVMTEMEAWMIETLMRDPQYKFESKMKRIEAAGDDVELAVRTALRPNNHLSWLTMSYAKDEAGNNLRKEPLPNTESAFYQHKCFYDQSTFEFAEKKNDEANLSRRFMPAYTWYLDDQDKPPQERRNIIHVAEETIRNLVYKGAHYLVVDPRKVGQSLTTRLTGRSFPEHCIASFEHMFQYNAFTKENVLSPNNTFLSALMLAMPHYRPQDTYQSIESLTMDTEDPPLEISREDLEAIDGFMTQGWVPPVPQDAPAALEAPYRPAIEAAPSSPSVEEAEEA